jgi:hypothetical protein
VCVCVCVCVRARARVYIFHIVCCCFFRLELNLIKNSARYAIFPCPANRKMKRHFLKCYALLHWIHWLTNKCENNPTQQQQNNDSFVSTSNLLNNSNKNNDIFVSILYLLNNSSKTMTDLSEFSICFWEMY